MIEEACRDVRYLVPELPVAGVYTARCRLCGGRRDFPIEPLTRATWRAHKGGEAYRRLVA